MQTSYGRHDHRGRHRYNSRLCARQHGRDHRVSVGRVRDRMVHRSAAPAPPTILAITTPNLAHLDIFASACRPASVIRTRTTSVCRPRATMRSRFVVASPALTSSTNMSIENPCARRIAVSSATELLFYLERAASALKRSVSLSRERLRTLHRAEDIGSALKGGVNALISNRAGARKQS
jgi:hypothetical protein